MDLHNAPFRRPNTSSENEYKDPAAWFRPDPDIWAPPPHHDPDVFAPPIDRYVSTFFYTSKLKYKECILYMLIRRPLQRPNANNRKTLDNNRKGAQSKSATSSKGGKKGNASSQPNTGRKRPTMNGLNESSQGKDEEHKEMEPADEEKRFEASNHMEGDLVDILGM